MKILEIMNNNERRKKHFLSISEAENSSISNVNKSLGTRGALKPMELFIMYVNVRYNVCL